MTSTLSRPAPASAPAPPAATRPPLADPWHWAVTGASLLAVLAAATSLNGVVEPWVWLSPVLRTLVPVLLAMALTRTLRLSGVLSALVGVLALVGALTAQFFPRQSILGVVPGPGTTFELRRLLAQAEETVVSQVAPVLPGAGIFLVICAALGLIAIIVDVFSTTMRMPAASGLGLLTVMIAPAIVKPNGVGMFAFITTVLAFLLLLALAQWRENRIAAGGARASSGFAGRSAIIGAAALAVTVILPLFIPGFNSGAFPQGARMNVWGSATGLNPAVTLGNDLRNPTGFGRIAYSTNSDAPLYLRAVTLEDFSGRRWEPDQRIDDREGGVAEIGAEEGTPVNPPEGSTVFTRITTQSYASPWLLSPYAPVGIRNLSGNWEWDPANLSILATDGGSTARQEYVVESRAAELTREGLGSIGPSDSELVPEVFSELPEDTPDIVRSTTDEVAGEFVNPYDKALAIQSYLRSAQFTYSVEAPVDGGYDGSGMDVMARFLESKSGYCVHYAGTMAVMARAAGIPSRVAIGYTPGSPTGDTEEGPEGTELREFVVDSRNAHAWPELYFEGVGWVQFEPTPSRGVVPTYAQRAFAPVGPRADDTDALNPGGILGGTGATDPSAEASENADDPQGAGPQDEARPMAGLLAVGGIALLALLPLLLRTARTRSRRRAVTVGGASGITDGAADTPGAATAAWAETTEMAGDYGYPLEPTDTPRTFAGRLLREAGLEGGPATSLGRLRTAYEYEEYADHAPDGAPAGGPSRPVATLARRVAAPRWEDVDAVTRALRRGSSWSRRIRARLFPQSLLNRFRERPRR
ncbi:transglutaminaseTgpA domain-containing protein [Arthrobacter sp. NPDC092385]|uniref:transglutaminase family protein n=1 Tax=Arthrobacter sp. NPDC092385 TaxID=3363943 RepID=UPI0038271FA5